MTKGTRKFSFFKLCKFNRVKNFINIFFFQTGSKDQQTSAAAFFARKNAANSHNGLQKSTANEVTNATKASEQVNHVSNFASILGKCPPPAPSSLLKKLQEETTTASTTVRFFLLYYKC